jgi:WD40 repeat protein
LSFRRTLQSAAAAAALLAILPAPAPAQYPFGQNKVVYSSRDWKVLSTGHVDIYYYTEEYALARSVAPMAEEAYREYEEYFQHSFDDPVPVVLYGTHHDFKQTNIIPNLISEFTAGFTDLIKGRVAIPYTGSYAALHHVVRHELVHAFMLDKLRVVMADHHRFGFSHPPLWFVEGLAEYVARRRPDTQHHMVIRDALLNDGFVPLEAIWRIRGSFLMYKEGESVVSWIATNYGDEALRLILESWWKADRFSEVLRASLGLDLVELNEKWTESLKKRYYPQVMTRLPADEQGHRVSGNAFLNTRPVVWSRETEAGKRRREIVYLSSSTGLVDVSAVTDWRADKAEGRRYRVIVEGGRSERFESIPASRSGMDVRGDTLAFVSKSGENDVVYLWDLERGKEIRKVSVEGLKILNSPSFSPDGGRMVFCGLEQDGLMDLYLYHLRDDRVQRLTEDIYDDADPDWHPSEERIVFSSDRCAGGLQGDRALYEMNLETGEIEPVTRAGHQDLTPRWSPDGKSLLFVSDRDGVFNAYVRRGEALFRATDVRGGVLHPAWFPDGRHFAATVYSGSSFHVYRFQIPDTEESRPVVAQGPPAPPGDWEVESEDLGEIQQKDYKSRFSLDFVGTAFALDPDFGSAGNGAQFVFTDVLGNHQIFALVSNTSQDFSDFWEKLNVGISYVNRSHRLHYQLGAFHLANYPLDSIDLYRFERRYGAVLGLSYPLSKFRRFDTSLVIRWIDRQDVSTLIDAAEGRGFTVGHFLAYTQDNTIWTIGGPQTGWRWNVTVGNTIDPEGNDFQSHTLQVDVRHYFKVSNRTILAQRFQSQNSWGGDVQLFYLGGGWDLRGYNFRQFFGRKVLLVNNELRFPLIDRLALRFPFGGLEFPSIRGAVYLDAGRAYDFLTDTGWVGSAGFGSELNLGYAPIIRVNVSRRIDYSGKGLPTRPGDNWYVGFFIGFNY